MTHQLASIKNHVSRIYQEVFQKIWTDLQIKVQGSNFAKLNLDIISKFVFEYQNTQRHKTERNLIS